MAVPTRFTAIENLQLAFNRMIRGQNRDYKSYLRHLYPSYQLAPYENLQNLMIEVKAGPSGQCSWSAAEKPYRLRSTNR